MQVERVMSSISQPERWGTFLRQYVEQYAETAITDVRRGDYELARVLLQNFVRIAGPTEIIKHLLAYEEVIPTSGDTLSAEELNNNKELKRRLAELRKGL
jgi:hypothetical protein